MLTQAMLGAISPNFRLVELVFEHDTWVVRVTLREESEADRKEQDDTCYQFSNYFADVTDLLSLQADAKIILDETVSQDFIILTPNSLARYVFLMREN